MNRYQFEAEVSGTCSLQVFANSEEEAKKKVSNGEWELVPESMETDCNLYGDTSRLNILDVDLDIDRKDYPSG